MAPMNPHEQRNRASTPLAVAAASPANSLERIGQSLARIRVEDLCCVPLLADNHLELLHSAAVNGLTHIDVAFGVHRHRVRMHEFAYLMARAAKAPEHAPAGTVHDVDLLIDFIDDVHEFLAWIERKFDGGSRTH